MSNTSRGERMGALAAGALAAPRAAGRIGHTY